MARQTARKKKETKKDRPVMWSDVTGVMRLYGKEFDGRRNGETFIRYSTSLGRKNEDGDYDNCYLTVFFPKDDAPGIAGAFEIVVTKGFMTLNVYDRGKGKNAVHVVEPAIMVQEYEFIDEDQEDDEDKLF